MYKLINPSFMADIIYWSIIVVFHQPWKNHFFKFIQQLLWRHSDATVKFDFWDSNLSLFLEFSYLGIRLPNEPSPSDLRLCLICDLFLDETKCYFVVMIRKYLLLNRKWLVSQPRGDKKRAKKSLFHLSCFTFVCGTLITDYRTQSDSIKIIDFAIPYIVNIARVTSVCR